MVRRAFFILAAGAAAVVMNACSGSLAPGQTPWLRYNLVASAQKSVVTVAAMDMDGSVSRIGSGFFIDREGTLVTNDHVLEGAYKAEIKTADGSMYPVETILARNPLFDLVEVRVKIPRDRCIPAALAEDEPAIADRVVVIGSPMGLEQTISEGIISAIREHPAVGKIYQLTAPISPGSSGGPVLNLKGQVIGVVTFQAVRGQNLNFAVSSKTLQSLPREPQELSLAEWNLQKAGNDPGVVLALCRQGAQLSIKGKYEAALDYFQRATEISPDDPETWRGLGSCYIGLGRSDKAIEAFHRAIAAAPDNTTGRFMLAMYHVVLKQDAQAVDLLQQVIGIAPDNLQARYELAKAYGRLGQAEAQIDTFQGILNLAPDHVPTLHRLGQLLAELHRYDEALDLLRKASALAPDNAAIHFDLGVTYNGKHLPEEELRAYARAIAADPQLAPAHFNIALLFLNQGNRKLALQEYAILKNLDQEAAGRLFKLMYPENLKQIKAPAFMK